MSIDVVFVAPNRRDGPDAFAAAGDDMAGKLPVFVVQANALAVEMNANAAAAGASAVAAAGSASTAGTAQAIATAAAQFKGDYSAVVTYQVGHSCAYGGKRWAAKTINTGVTPAAGANWMELPVVATMPRLARTANTMLTTSDNGALLDITSGTFTQTFDTPANLLAGWSCLVRNSGSGTVTLALSTSIALYPGELRLVQCDGATLRSVPIAGRRQIVVRDEKTSGSAGGTGTVGAYVTRTLNTVAANSLDGASLASNQITLPAGIYSVRASCPAYQVSACRARLYNVTAAAVSLVGTTEFASGANGCVRSVISGVITLTATSVLRLEMRVGVSNATSDFGVPASFGDVEVYSEITIERID